MNSCLIENSFLSMSEKCTDEQWRTKNYVISTVRGMKERIYTFLLTLTVLAVERTALRTKGKWRVFGEDISVFISVLSSTVKKISRIALLMDETDRRFDISLKGMIALLDDNFDWLENRNVVVDAWHALRSHTLRTSFCSQGMTSTMNRTCKRFVHTDRRSPLRLFSIFLIVVNRSINTRRKSKLLPH